MAKRTGFFGGSFNPIHNGHIELAKSIMHMARLDEVWFVVSPHNPLKDCRSLLPDGDRLQMAKIAVSNEEGLVASDCEFRLPKPSYTLTTLTAIAEEYPDRQFVLLIGADNWNCFGKWRDSQQIISRYDICVYPRRGCAVDETALPPSVTLLHTSLYDISSTKIRQRLREGESITGLVPAEVERYIYDNNLKDKIQ